MAQVFCWEFCEISENTFFYRTTLVAVSAVHKKQDFSTSISERSEKCISLFFHFCYFMIGFLWSLYLYTIFLWCGERLNTRANQKKIKSSRKEYAMWTCFKFWPMKNIFRKIQANRSLAMAWEIYRELLPLATYLRVHSNSKEVSYLSWQNKYSNLKTTCHTKLKFFLWTKLLENLLITKYLISVAATLNNKWKKLCCYTISKNS